MRDEHGHLVQMNGPLLMGRGIPIAMVPVVPVVNGNEPGAVPMPPVPAAALGNGAREVKYDDKSRIYSPQQTAQSKNMNRKLPTNGAHRMPVRPLFNSKAGQAQVRAPTGSQVSGAPLGAPPIRHQMGTYRYNIPPAPPPYASFPAITDDIFLPVNISVPNYLAEETEIKFCKKSVTVECCKLSKQAEQRICIKSKDFQEDIGTVLEKECTGISVVDRHKRKVPVSPLEINSVCNSSSLNVDDGKNALSCNKNTEITLPKPMQSKKIDAKSVNNITDSCNKNSEGENDSNSFNLALFESPEKTKKIIGKLKISSVKEVKKNIFTKKNVSSLVEDDHLKVLKPINCYQSPHQSKKARPRTKAAPNEQKFENNEANYQPKKHISRTKAAPGGKQNSKDQNEQEVIASLNQHFAEFETMDLCIE